MRKARSEKAKRVLRQQCALSHNTLPKKEDCEALVEEESHEETKEVVELHHRDTTVTLHYKTKERDPVLTVPVVDVEIGLSYGLVTGFHSAGSGFTLSGTLEEFPVVATYVDFLPEGRITPYLAMRAGLTKLSALRAYTLTDSLYTASGSTYLLGGGVGVAVRVVDKVFAYAEYDATYRHYPSVEWSASSGAVPGYLPRRLRLSTHELSLGLQLRVR